MTDQFIDCTILQRGKEKKRRRRKWRKRRKLIINITFVMNKIIFSKVVDVYKVIDRKSWMFNKKWGGLVGRSPPV